MTKRIFLTIVAAIVFAGFTCASHATMYLYNVPDVRGMTKAQAESTLKAKNYIITFAEVEAGNYNQLGKVAKQEPMPGGYFLAEKRNISVTVYIASKGSFVPFTLLMPESAAVDAVKKAGYVPKVEYYSEEQTGMVGKVKATVPAPYLNLAKGGTVTLRVGAPGYPMPNFVGNYAQGAKTTIDQLNSVKKLNLKSSVTQGKTTAVAQDDQRIYEQSPAPGAVLRVGTEIRLFALKYMPPPPPPGTIVMPNLLGKPEPEAVSILTKAGMKVSVTYRNAPRPLYRRLVMGQSVSAGTQTSGPVVLTVGR